MRFNQTGVEIGRTYDGLGRVTKKEYSKASKFFTTEYSFLAGANGNTTGILSSVTNNNETISYTYDDNGNIATITEGNTEKARYAYDGLNQLVREDNKYLDKTITYTYDAGGNLTSKKEYAYTTGTLGTVTKTINYTYGDTNWKDKLTAYNGKAITYDQIGNPLTYDGKTFSWTGRQLDSITNSNDSISYTYNADGIRTSKTVNGVTTKYFLHGDRITLEKVGNEERAFWYDGDGNAAAFVIYDSTGKHPYYYMRNGQDDIIGLFDVTGAVVARYTYDSWGKLVSITDGNGTDKTNDTTFFGCKNPLRYRGYYYDNETGLYYLQSRYYNPEWGRFLNADGITTASLLGTNLFIYCYNNPVTFEDPSGFCPGYSPANMSYSAWEQHLKYCTSSTIQQQTTTAASLGNRKPGKTPPSKWPDLPEKLGGKKPKWNPDGYWEGKNGRRLTWDDHSHGTGIDRGNGAQDGHWDDENSNDRWTRNGDPLNKQYLDTDALKREADKYLPKPSNLKYVAIFLLGGYVPIDVYVPAF